MEKLLVYMIKTNGASIIIEKDTDTYYTRLGNEEKPFLTTISELLVLRCILGRKEITPEDRKEIEKRIKELEEKESE